LHTDAAWCIVKWKKDASFWAEQDAWCHVQYECTNRNQRAWLERWRVPLCHCKKFLFLISRVTFEWPASP